MNNSILKSTKSISGLILGTSCALLIAASGSQAMAADSETTANAQTRAQAQVHVKTKRKVTPRKVNHAKYDVMAEKGIFLRPAPTHDVPAKSSKHKVTPRKVNHAKYDVMAEKGIFLYPPRAKKNPSELAKRRNHAEYDTSHDGFGG